jgi:hypothetical protein
MGHGLNLSRKEEDNNLHLKNLLAESWDITYRCNKSGEYYYESGFRSLGASMKRLGTIYIKAYPEGIDNVFLEETLVKKQLVKSEELILEMNDLFERAIYNDR